MKSDITVKYKLSNGKTIAGETPSTALSKWLMHKSNGNFVVSTKNANVSCIMPGPYHAQFITSLLETFERNYSKTPYVDAKLLKKDWYQSGLPSDVFDPDVVNQNKFINSKIGEYEEWCHEVLNWLVEFGDVRDLKFMT
jgi:hypothetical protein